jgi:homoserine dehydrogenase
MRILIIGFGTVGRALAALLEDSRARLTALHGLAPKIVGVVDSRGGVVSGQGLGAQELLEAKKSPRGLAGMAGGFAAPVDLPNLVGSVQADCVIQVVPSDLTAPGAAVNQLKVALASRKHAVTATKAPLGIAMSELLELAAGNKVQLRYSATVGAGTPFLDLAASVARADRIERVEAILNGTTNFILSSMDAGAGYAEALAEATRLGYAETDPSNDVDGIDTAVKLVILANHSMGAKTGFADVKVKGIRSVTAAQVAAAKSAGKVIRLIGRIDESGLRVGPEEVEKGGPLDLPGATNAAVFTTATCGTLTLRGSGAGGANTASAIVRDLVEIWRTTRS